jgi:transglutaminase-like putative cysteine protease
LACATLGYAEYPYLPEVPYFTLLVLGLMVLTFRRDGRNELSLEMANRVGLVIGITVIAYLAFHFFKPGDSLLDHMPLPAGLLPFLGPVFMVLIPAKLLRPKHVGDWWAMHGVGFAAVCLACVMEDDSTLAILVTAYLAVGVWSLMLFYFRRGCGAVPPIPRTGLAQATEPVARVVSAADAPPRSRFGGIRARRPASYLFAAAAAGFLLFILTPRTDTPHWSLASYREVGFTTDEQAPDLTKTGDLKDNRDRAFEVVARNRDGTPKLDLDPMQRWRGASFVTYQGGKWEAQRRVRGPMISSLIAAPLSLATNTFQSTFEAAGPDGYVLEFNLNGKRKDPVQADPTWWAPGVVSPFCTSTGTDSRSWFQFSDGTFYPPGGRSKSKQYVQVNRPPQEPDLGPAFQITRGTAVSVALPADAGLPKADPNAPSEDTLYLATIDHLRFNPLPRVKTWTEQLITRLVAEGAIPKEVAARYVPAEGTFPVSDFEPVARAITKYFTSSGEFTYGTENTRLDKALDPVEDFLLHTKSGSCEWYATALTLCLRSVGIPCQCVLGFKGCEPEDDGRYAIRQDNAHAWVEVLIPRPIPHGFPVIPEIDARHEPLPPPTRVWHWLSLDPTPGIETQTDTGNGISGLWSTIRANWLSFFNDFVVRYDPDRRQRAAAAAEKWATANWPTALAGMFGILSLGVIGLIIRGRQRKTGPIAAAEDPLPVWYRQFLTAAESAGFGVTGGETPREFADRLIATVPAAESAANVLTDTLYRVRYAGEPPPPPGSLAPSVSDAEAALAATGSPPTGV